MTVLFILIFSFFCSPLSVWAQNVVIQVYDPQSLVVKSNSLLPMIFSGPKNSFSPPIQKELAEYYVSSLDELKELVFIDFGRTENKGAVNAGFDREAFKSLYNKPRVDEKEALRREWAEAFGFDVWSPYYKYKEIEKLVKKKLSVQIFKLKGEPRLEKGKIFYVFAAAF